MAFSPDGRLAASGAYDRTVRVWDLRAGRELHRLEGHVNDVMSVAFSPDGGEAVSGSKDRSLRRWDVTQARRKSWRSATTPKCTAAGVERGRVARRRDRDLQRRGRHRDAVGPGERGGGPVVRGPHRERLGRRPLGGRPLALSAGSDKSVRLWGVESGLEVARWKGHSKSIWGVAFSPDGTLAVSGGYDKTVRIWDVASGKEVHRLEGHTQYVLGVAFSPDGRRVVSASRDKTLCLWTL